MSRFTKAFIIGSIRIYRAVKECLLVPPRCRYFPSCSEYAEDSIHKHGPKKGLWLSLTRILRCHPAHPGGWDPVP